MVSFTKKHLIPHKGNNFRPHLLRGKNAFKLVVLALVVEVIFFLGPVFNVTDLMGTLNLGAVLPSVLSELTNEERLKVELEPLVENSLLTQAATLKAEDMATKEYFAHVSPEGIDPWHWLETVGYKYDYAGENLAIQFSDSKDVTRAWMNSPTHKANIVKAAYTEIGTGIATGTYKGRETVYIAQVYANPRMEKARVPAATVASVSVVAPTAPASVPVRAPAATSASGILGSETQTVTTPEAPTEPPTVIEKVAVSPRHTTNVIFMVIGSLVALAIIFLVFRAKPKLHLDLVTNGALVIVVLFGLFIANGYIGSKNADISLSMDYSRQK